MAKVEAKRAKNKDNARRSKKKISILNTERVEYVDYKDVNLLRRFMSDRAKIRARRVTGNSDQQQREQKPALRTSNKRTGHAAVGGGGGGSGCARRCNSS